MKDIVYIKVNDELSFEAPKDSEIVKDFEKSIVLKIINDLKNSNEVPSIYIPNSYRDNQLQYWFNDTYDDRFFIGLHEYLINRYSKLLKIDVSIELLVGEYTYATIEEYFKFCSFTKSEEYDAVHLIDFKFNWK